MNDRIAGILLHPTSLPASSGIGDFGRGADHFLDWASRAGMGVWQILPLGPTAHGNSPYSGTSAFAGNPLLIAPERLVEEGLLAEADLRGAPRFPDDRVDFAGVLAWKEKILRLSWRRFRERPPGGMREASEAFARDPGRSAWLEDWALYSALKDRFAGKSWAGWPRDLRQREASSLAAARREMKEEVEYRKHLQFLFFRQWDRVKQEARGRGIRVMGDLPLYVALDSADVWAHPELFDLDDALRPRSVAGVPPDYFSRTGQRWGNPLYRWDRMADEGYVWWIARVRENLREVDLLRIDHFRGLAAYWEIPAEEATAVKGVWRPGPAGDFFEALRGALGELPLIAEDLGIITEEVVDLRDSLGLPGMKVLQFAFDTDDSDHLPGRFPPENVIYTGTHDNDTLTGWLAKLEEASRERVLDFLGEEMGPEIHWDLIRAALESEARLAVIPLQDVLGLGSEARMNNPATAEGNWGWRVPAGSLRPREAERLRELVLRAGRCLPGEASPRLR